MFLYVTTYVHDVRWTVAVHFVPNRSCRHRLEVGLVVRQRFGQCHPRDPQFESKIEVLLQSLWYLVVHTTTFISRYVSSLDSLACSSKSQ